MPRGQRVLDHELASMIDTHKNDMEWVAQWSQGSKHKIWWICQCGESFERPIRRVTQGGQIGCKSCSNVKKAESLRIFAIHKNGSLRDQLPDLALDWHPDNSIGSDEVLPYSSDSVMWKCHKCSHEWETSPRRRSQCPSCPACPPEWSIGHTEFRNHIDPSQDEYDGILNLGVYSKRKIKWICMECSDSFSRAISAVNDKESILCRSCRNLDTGSLADNRPDLVDEWHPDNTLGPDEVTHYEWAWVKWICKDCSHEWETAVANRTSKGSGCPNCWKRSGPTSRIEIELREQISVALGEMMNPNTYVHADLDDARRHVVADMTTDDNIAIEYDSEYWHRDRMDRDKERLQIMFKAGYTVISVREEGLPLLTATDLVYASRREAISDLAQRVAEQIRVIRSARA